MAIPAFADAPEQSSSGCGRDSIESLLPCRSGCGLIGPIEAVLSTAGVIPDIDVVNLHACDTGDSLCDVSRETYVVIAGTYLV
jgi:hypothetical protein